MRERRSLAPLALPLVLTLALLLGACSVGGDDDPTATATTAAQIDATATTGPDETATQSSAPTATAPPADPTATIPTDASPSASPPSGFTDAEAALLDLLLATNDLTGEWNQLRVEAIDESDGPGICGAEPFPQADQRIAEVEVEYQSDDNARFVLQNLTEYPIDVAEAALDHIRETATCDEWTDESGTVFEVEPLDAPDLGDEAHALHIAFEVADAGTLEGDLIFVRVGGYVTTLTTLEFDDYDADDAIAVATLAVAKLRAGAAAAITEDDAALIESLLSLDEMPGNWNQLQNARRSDPESWTGLCDAELFPDAGQATARVAVELYEGFDAESASLQQLLVAYPPDIAEAAFDYEEASASCDEFERGSIDVTLEPADAFPALGDDSFAVHFTFENDDDEVEGYWIVIRSGNRLTTLIYTDPDDFDPNDAEEIAERATEKLAGGE